MRFQQAFAEQRFANDYQLVNGVEMNAANPNNFKIPPEVLKKHISSGHFVELRVDSPRFAVHDDAAEKCYCSTCNGEMTKPILCHQHPASFVNIPKQNVPSRGWGEDFWVRVENREGEWFKGVVDNNLAESRLHGLRRGSSVYFHEDQILAIHGSHREEIVRGMNEVDLKILAQWLGEQRR